MPEDETPKVLLFDELPELESAITFDRHRSYSRTVRVGLEVTKSASTYLPYDFRMFHMRSWGIADDGTFSTYDWVQEGLEMMDGDSLPGLHRLEVDVPARFWVHMRLRCFPRYYRYYGEYENETEIEILNCRRIK